MLKRADEQRVEMEYLEGYEVATNEILLKKMQDEKEVVYLEMRKAADKYEADKAEEKRLADIEAENARASKELYSANLLQGVARKWSARKKLREKCYKIYKKEFDRDTFQFYYVDQRNDHITWRKPYALGTFDMKCKDEWVRCFDESKHEYFYNPLTLRMQWSRPLGTVLCEKCEVEFAKRYDNEDKSLSCVECWTKAHVHLKKPRERIRLSWKEIDGGMEEAESALSQVGDFPDHNEAEKGLITADDTTDADLAIQVNVGKYFFHGSMRRLPQQEAF